MKKSFSIAILFSLLLVSFPAFAFDDIDTSPNKDAIEYLEEAGVVEGYSNDEFHPYADINRAEFTKIVMEQLYPGESSGENCFLDVGYDWYADYVCEARSRGVVGGYPDGNFHPEAEINLVEALSVVLNAYDIEVTSSHQEWYEQYYWMAFELSLLETIDSGMFDSISRGEMAQLVYNVEMYLTEDEPSYANGKECFLYDDTESYVFDYWELLEVPGDEAIVVESAGSDAECAEYAEARYGEDYEIYETTNEDYDITWLGDEELETTIMAIEKENVVVLVPEGYEELGKVYVDDLLYCDPLLSDFFGFDFPEDELVTKIYISSDDSNQSSSIFGKIFYRKSQENMDFALEDILTNNPEGFLYNSSSSYCANSHELAHAFVQEAPVPGWFNEGLAEFTQKYNQGDIKDSISCGENGYYRDDDYYPYPNLREDLDYPAAMCLVETLLNDPENSHFGDVMDAIYAFIEDPELESEYLDIIPDGQGVYTTTELIFSKVLIEVLGTSVSEDLIKYGIDLEDMNLL
jgi:hypothetical protein